MKSATFFCENCGQQLSSDYVYCPKCNLRFGAFVCCSQCYYKAEEKYFHNGCPKCYYMKDHYLNSFPKKKQRQHNHKKNTMLLFWRSTLKAAPDPIMLTLFLVVGTLLTLILFLFYNPQLLAL